MPALYNKSGAAPLDAVILVAVVSAGIELALTIRVAFATPLQFREARIDARSPLYWVHGTRAVLIVLRTSILYGPSQHHDYDCYLQNGKEIAFHPLPLSWISC
jgi:hypothetical protein